MNRLLALLCVLLCVLTLMLTGCGGRQLEEELLVIVLAVDQTPAGGMQLAVKVPGNQAEGKNAGEAGGQEGYLLLKAAGRGFSEAFTLLNATTPRKLNFSQVREIVVGERAARDPDLALILRQIDALPRFRCSAAVIVCRGDAWEFADRQRPYVGSRLSRYAETSLSNYAGKGFTPDTNLCQAVRDMGADFLDPLFICGAINHFDAPDASPDASVLDALPGGLARESENAIEVFGAAATDGVSVSGFLTGYETALVNLMRGHVEALIIQQEENVPLSVYPHAPARLTVELSAWPVALQVDLRCEVRYPPGYPPDEAALRQTLIRDLSAVIAKLQSFRCDGLGFGSVAARQFLTVQAWEARPWRALYEEARVDVRLSLQCRGS